MKGEALDFNELLTLSRSRRDLYGFRNYLEKEARHVTIESITPH